MVATDVDPIELIIALAMSLLDHMMTGGVISDVLLGMKRKPDIQYHLLLD